MVAFTSDEALLYETYNAQSNDLHKPMFEMILEDLNFSWIENQKDAS